MEMPLLLLRDHQRGKFLVGGLRNYLFRDQLILGLVWTPLQDLVRERLVDQRVGDPGRQRVNHRRAGGPLLLLPLKEYA